MKNGAKIRQLDDAALAAFILSLLKGEEYFQHAPCNIALDFRKGRSCKSGESNYLLFDGDYMTFVDNEKQLERIRAAAMKRKTGSDFGGTYVKDKNIPMEG